LNKASILCLLALFAGCTQYQSQLSTSSSNLKAYDERDAISNAIPTAKTPTNQHPVVGVKKVLIVLIDWNDKTTMDPVLTDKLVFSGSDSLNAYLKHASRNKLSLTGKIITHKSGDRPPECRPGPPRYPAVLARTEAKKAATAHGLKTEDFDFIFAHIDCRDMGSAPYADKWLYVYGQPAGPFIYYHEFGHALGYAHGSTYTGCPKAGDTVSAPTGCKKVPYGDPGSPVSGGLLPYNGKEHYFSGWHSGADAKHITKTGLYSLGILSASGPQVHLINLSTAWQLALDYRTSERIPKGAWIRYANRAGVSETILVDSSPETPAVDPTFQPGHTFKDIDAGISVHVCGLPRTGNDLLLSVGINAERSPDCTSELVMQYPQEGDTVNRDSIFSGYTRSSATPLYIFMEGKNGENIVRRVYPKDAGKWTFKLDDSIKPGKYNVWMFHTPEETTPITVTVEQSTY
jgi:hypothetical protein